jgi:hypothetical protein
MSQPRSSPAALAPALLLPLLLASGQPAGAAEPPLPAPPASAGAPAAAVATLGEPVKLLDEGRFGLRFFPDMPVTVLSPPPRLRLLVAAEISTALVEGADLEHLTGATRKVLAPGKKGEFDNGYAGATGAVEAGGALYVAYHAEDQEGMGKLAGSDGVPGFHASVGLATSTDGGRTFQKLGQAVTSFRPKGWTFYDGQHDSGAGDSWLMRSHDGAYWYLYYTDHSRDGGRGVQICMARAPASAPPAPGAFRKFHDGAFDEPGLGGRDTPVLSGQAFDQGEVFSPQVVYSPTLKLYVMVMNLDVWKEFVETKRLARSGMYLATSADGVRWSRPEPMAVDWAVPVPGKSLSWHPTIVFDPGSSTEGWLLYGHTAMWSPSHGAPAHVLWGRRISLARRT